MTGTIGSTSKRIVIAGGSGFLGTSLAAHLTGLGYEVVILSRNAPASGDWAFQRWDARTVGDWAASLDGALALVNLAGRTVDCVKTPLHCDQILRSRVEATKVLGQAIQTLSSPPKVWVQMSTAHIYGDSELPCTEDSATGYGLAPIVGTAWEGAFDESCPVGIRRVVLRTSFVLGKQGAAWKKLKLITKLGFGGTLSSGTQGMSWIHEGDMNRIFQRAIESDTMNGIYISSAPNPVSNREFMRAMRKQLGMPIGLPAAAWMIHLGARFILKTDPELALYGRYVIPERIVNEGFEFNHPHLTDALNDLCS
ncbi:MAG: TIGR01777 family oxidoreductase [Phycisphaerales bacterium]|nr:TIGR01777 family oxidoreductase [Phycisphaerales bacterium]